MSCQASTVATGLKTSCENSLPPQELSGHLLPFIPLSAIETFEMLSGLFDL